MALRMQDFKCKACDNVQEELVATSSDASEYQAERDCDKCGAGHDQMEPVLGLGAHGKHVSWSKWRV